MPGVFQPGRAEGAPLARSRSPFVFSLFFVRCMYGLPSAPPAELVVACRWVVIPTGYRAFPLFWSIPTFHSHFFLKVGMEVESVGMVNTVWLLGLLL